jgi:hypothetical protein
MNKLIKLSETHYIIVDDSEIKEGDYKHHHVKGIAKAICNGAYTNEFKITHSTQPLEEVCCTPHSQVKRYLNCKGCDRKQLGFVKIKPLSLSEVEEAINGYSAEKMADEYVTDESYLPVHKEENYRSYINGFNAHKELVKDKLFTTQDVIDIVEKSRETGLTAEYFITKYLLPKTEWTVTFNENNKLKLI